MPALKVGWVMSVKVAVEIHEPNLEGNHRRYDGSGCDPTAQHLNIYCRYIL